MFHAPEMFKQDKIRGEKTDIWALGVTFYYMMCGKYPHTNFNNIFEFRAKVLENNIDYTPIKNKLA